MARRRAFGDTALAAIVWGSSALVFVAFFCILGDLLFRGASELSWAFLTEAPADAGRQGGILSILVSTGLILLVCLVTSLPLSIAAAAFLADSSVERGAFARVVRRAMDVLSGIPSIVFGLFGSAFFCQFLGLGFSILAGGLTLSCMVLPILVRATEEGLRAAAHEHGPAAAALGLKPSTVLLRLTLPLAMPAVVVGLVLSIGRALAETAALIFTSGYVTRMPESLYDSGRALSIHVFDLSMNVPGGDHRAAASALVLIVVVLGMNIAAGRLDRSRSKDASSPDPEGSAVAVGGELPSWSK